MKILWACQTCKKQYDISTLALGSAFRCSCSTVVRVPKTLPEVKDLAVAHCAACGAAKTEGSFSCLSCKSEFRTFERDRSTMCPSCYARISDHSQYCHSCGVTIDPNTQVDVDPSKMSCPVCQKNSYLVSRTLNETIKVILECPRCEGHFLSHSELEQILSHSDAESLPSFRAPIQIMSAPLEEGPFYKNCPYCKSMMNRKNFGTASGVIIDVCAAHGVWLDANEIEMIVRWIKQGGLQKARETGLENLEFERKRAVRERVQNHPVDTWINSNNDHQNDIDFLEWIGTLFRLLR